MKILGIDPGSIRTGYAIIEVSHQKTQVLDFGVWQLSVKGEEELGFRLEKLYKNVKELLQQYNPHVIGLEKAVTFKNIPSALKLSEARGVIRLAVYELLADAQKRLIELSPTEVKKKSTGSGAANKETITRVLRMRFPGLASLSQSQRLTHDAFDALAVAWTTWIVHKERYGRKIGPTICS